MFTRILVPLDGSARAEKAAVVAAGYARRIGSALVLARVVHAPPGLSFAGEPTISAMEAAEVDVARAEEYLRVVKSRQEFADLDVGVVVLEGQIVPTILDIAESEQADAIMLSSHGRSGATRWVFGSIAHALLRSAPMPVFVLSDSERIGPIIEGGVARVLVALDGTEKAERAIMPAADLVQGLNKDRQGVLRLVRVVPLLDAPENGGRDASVGERTERQHAIYALAMAEAHDYLHGVCERLAHGELAGRSITLESAVVASLDIGQALVDAARGAVQPGASEVIAMATHGRSGLEGWVLGSIAERVLDSAHMPMLIISTRVQPSRTAREPVRTYLGHL